MPHNAVSRLELLGAAFLFSTGGAAIKATTLTGWQVACFRSAVAGIVLFLLLPSARRNWSWRAPLVGLAYAATLISFVVANKLTTAANTIFLQSTAPLYLLLLGPWLLRERIRRPDVVVMAVIAVGFSFFFLGRQESFATAPDPFRGNAIAAASGVFWALTIAGLRWAQSLGQGKECGLATVVAGNLIAALVSLPMALPVAQSEVTDWVAIGYLGVFQIGLAYVLLTRGVRHVPALATSLLMLAEPAMNPVWAWLAHGERPGPLALAGGALILAGAIGRTLRSASDSEPGSVASRLDG